MKGTTKTDNKKDTASTNNKATPAKTTTPTTTTTTTKKETTTVKTTPTTKVDDKTSPTKPKDKDKGEKSNLVSTQNSKATLDVKKTVKKGTDAVPNTSTNNVDNKSTTGKTATPSTTTKEKAPVTKTNTNTNTVTKDKNKETTTNTEKEKPKTEAKDDNSNVNTTRDNKKDTINNSVLNDNINNTKEENEFNNTSNVDNSILNTVNNANNNDNTETNNNTSNNDFKLEKENTSTNENIINNLEYKDKSNNNSNLNTPLVKEVKNSNKTLKFENNKLLIEKVEFFPELSLLNSLNKKETKEDNESLPIIVDGEECWKLSKKLSKKDFFLPSKSVLNTSSYNIHNNNNGSYIAKKYGRLVSPVKKNKGVSVFSKHTVNIDTAPNSSLYSVYSPTSYSNNKKVYFDNNFNTENSSLRNSEFYNYHYLQADRKPFFKFEVMKSINDSINNNHNNNLSSMNNFNNNNINFNINYNNISENHLEYLKELKGKYKEKPDLSNITVPANTLTKEALLSPELAFNKEYKNILEKQKLKLTNSTNSNSINLAKLTNSSYNNYSNNIINTRNKPSNISTLLAKKKRGINNHGMFNDLNSDNFSSGFRSNTSNEMYNNKEKGLTTKGADMYVKFCEKMKLNNL